MTDLDLLTVEQLITEASKHFENWRTLTHHLRTRPNAPADWRRNIWARAEDHAELAMAMTDAARLRIAEEDAARHG